MKLLNSFIQSLERMILPVASKLASNKFLVALRDSFIATMPVVMVGSTAVLINALLRDIPGQFNLPWIPETFAWLININGLIWNGTLAIVGLLFIFSLGSNVAKLYDVDSLQGGLVAVAAFIQGIGWAPSTAIEVALDSGAVDAINAAGGAITATPTGISANLWGWLNYNHLNANAYFTGIALGFITVIIFSKLINKDITIKLPDSVPPAISKAFTAIIPAIIALYIVAIFNWSFTEITGKLFIDWIIFFIQQPLLSLSQGFIPVILTTFFVSFFWFFGMHGANIFAPVLEGVFGVAQNANINAYQNNLPLPYMWVKGSFDAFVWFSGFCLIIAIFLASKNKHYRSVAKIAAPPIMFNIGEPLTFGIPLVLNPIMLIPQLLAPTLMATVAYFATVTGLVSPVSQNVTWVMPPILNGFFATGMDWRSIILSLVTISIGVLTFIPFVIMANDADFE